ncbi:hypothetical protein LIA77_05455 [Sarocladium implicatum]|nr:hypothetical protein LIA77_05455 [Sarocladium implicatum]
MVAKCEISTNSEIRGKGLPIILRDADSISELPLTLVRQPDGCAEVMLLPLTSALRSHPRQLDGYRSRLSPRWAVLGCNGWWIRGFKLRSWRYYCPLPHRYWGINCFCGES